MVYSRILLLFALLLSGFGWCDAETEAARELKAIVKEADQLASRISQASKPPKSSASEEQRRYEELDQALEQVRQDISNLSKRRLLLAKKLPTQSPVNQHYNRVGDLLNALDSWREAHAGWLFAGAKNPSLKAVEKHDKEAEAAYRKLAQEVAKELR